MVRPESPKIAYEDAFCMVATWRSIVMPVMGRQSLPAASAKQQVRALVEHGKRLGPGRMAEITLISHDAPLPEADTRAALDAGVPLVSPYYGCVSAVFEATGFRGAFVRGMLTSFQMLSRTKFPQKIFSSIDAAAKWTFPHLSGMGMQISSAEELIQVVRGVHEMAVTRGVLSPHVTQVENHVA
ncbi:Hypothetical protein A7982_05386 [Minicystis rosea]|nr:Hypothetical protein A7982_05386 [Minicystis rosea]